MTSLANQRSCSLNSSGGRPSAQWIMKSSSPGYFASIDLMPSMTCLGGPQNHAFCWMPSRRLGVRAGAHLLRVHDVAAVAEFLAVWRVLEGEEELASEARLSDRLRWQQTQASARPLG